MLELSIVKENMHDNYHSQTTWLSFVDILKYYFLNHYTISFNLTLIVSFVAMHIQRHLNRKRKLPTDIGKHLLLHYHLIQYYLSIILIIFCYISISWFRLTSRGFGTSDLLQNWKYLRTVNSADFFSLLTSKYTNDLSSHIVFTILFFFSHLISNLQKEKNIMQCISLRF